MKVGDGLRRQRTYERVSVKEPLLELQDHQIHRVFWRIKKERSPGRVSQGLMQLSRERIPKNGRANVLKLYQESPMKL